MGNQSKPMKKLICILASAALLGGCEEKTNVVTPASSPAPDKKVENNTTVKIEGADKEAVGQVAAELRAVRPPEPYKGKGIRYQGEQVRRKAGKTGAK